MRYRISFILTLVYILTIVSCKKSGEDNLNNKAYFEVGFKDSVANWRDSSFIVASSDRDIIEQAEAHLILPVSERKIVFGKLQAGNAGYNHNASHFFKWHFNEDEWSLVDVTIEIYDGRPFSDVDSDTSYWLNTMTRYGSWSSYIKRKLHAPLYQ